MSSASGNTPSVFADSTAISDASAMLTADEILAELDRLGVRRATLAKVLGVAQPNATRLYAADPRSKSGAKRALTWDEGCALIREFKLSQEGASQSPVYLNEELLRPIVGEIAAAARRDRSDAALGPLTTALAQYLQQIDTRPSIRSSPDALDAVAQTAASPIRQSKH